MKSSEVIENLKRRYPGQPEYIQAVSQVLPTIEETYNQHPEFEKVNLIERLCIPDRIYQFRVTWVDDKGKVQINNGYRVQRHWSVQRRYPFPLLCKPRHFEVPCFRADIQELSHHSSHGWCQRW